MGFWSVPVGGSGGRVFADGEWWSEGAEGGAGVGCELSRPKNRHRSPQSTMAAKSHSPSGRGGGITLRPADFFPAPFSEAGTKVRPHGRSE